MTTPVIESQKRITLATGTLTPAAGRRYPCTLIAAGPLKRRRMHIPPDVLADAFPHFVGLPAFVDHSNIFQGQSLARLLGVFEEVKLDALTNTITAQLQLWETDAADWTQRILDEVLRAQDEGKPTANIGLSAELYFDIGSADNTGSRPVTKILAVDNVAVVFNPASDGARFSKILASVGPLPPAATQEKEVMEPTNTVPVAAAPTTPPPPTPVIVAPPSIPHADTLQALNQALLDIRLSASDLPEPFRATVRARFEGQAFTPAALDTEIALQKSLHAKLVEGNVVQGFGTPEDGGTLVHGMRTNLDRLQLAVDAMVAGVRPADARPLTGVRELYQLLSGDYAMTGLFQAEHVHLANVTTSTMAGMVANALNKVVINLWQQYPKFWEKAVTPRDFTNLNDARWITLGGIGELPTVAEGGVYTELSWDDQTETDAFNKKGGYLGLTLEAIDRDQTGKLQAAPQALTQAAWLTLGKAIAAIFTTATGTGPTMSDAVVLFHAGTHSNLLTTAMSPAAIKAVDHAMKKQTELNSDERLGALTRLHYLWVPIDLVETAVECLASANVAHITDNTVNVQAEGDARSERLRRARERVIEVPFWTDTNNWAAQANPLLYPSIGLGFRFGRLPEVFSVTDPKAGLMFSNDVMPIKVRFFFAVGPTDWRGLHKSNVS